MTRKFEIDATSLVQALRHLEVLVLSIDRIGAASIQMTKEEELRVLSDFFDDWAVSPRLKQIRYLLSAVIEYDELEQLFSNIEAWRTGQRQPSEEELERQKRLLDEINK